MERGNGVIVSAVNHLHQTVRSVVDGTSTAPSGMARTGSTHDFQRTARRTDATSGEQGNLNRQLAETSPSPAEVFAETGLSPEDYIARLVGDAGGRLAQQDIVRYTDWSAATVSRRLQTMEAEGEIIRLRVGRKKVVCLPEAVPDRG